MSSWNRGPSRPPPRIGYYQSIPEGTFRQTTEDSTVVSAYYPVKSKRPIAFFGNVNLLQAIEDFYRKCI